MQRGANCYYLLDMYMAHDDALIQQTWDVVQKSESRILRIWAFSLSHTDIIPPGTIPDILGQALDRLFHDAHDKGIRIILTLTDYWLDCGRYVTYQQGGGESSAGKHAHREHFFSLPTCREQFTRYVTDMLTRYGQHPALYAIDLMNEPRCAMDPSGETFLSWLRHVTQHARHVLNQQPCRQKPILTIGLEGFDGAIPSTPEWARSLGVPWSEAVAYVDAASIHLWPDQWWPECKQATCSTVMSNEPEQQSPLVKRAVTWVEEHAALLAALYPDKPLLLTEYGCKRVAMTSDGRMITRREYCDAVLACAERSCAIACIWMVAGKGYEEHDDGYSVYVDDL